MLVFSYHLARIADNLSNHIRLREHTRCHSSVRIGQFQQIHFGRTQRGRGVGMQRCSNSQTPRRPQDALNPNLLGDPNRSGISGFRKRLPEGDHTLELTIVVGDPFHILVPAIGDADGLVRHHAPEVESGP